jgi:glycine/D-amino acid oxidase-like deaminating enzyme
VTHSTASDADVVVIGGGIAGVAAAAHLAETGRRVVLVEREAIGAGASGRNSGVVQHPFDPVLVELHLASLERYRALAAVSDGRFRLPPAPAGLLLVTHDAQAARLETEELAASHPMLEPRFLAPGEAARLEPALAPDVAACRLAIGYPVGPVAATRTYAAWATSLGVEIHLGSTASLDVVGGRVRGVELSEGAAIAARTVVVAAGPWSPSLVDPSARWRPIRPNWGVVVEVTLAAPPSHVLEEAGIDIEPPPDDGRIDLTPERAPGVETSLVTADGVTALGSTFLDEEPDPATWVPRILARGATYVPGIETARVGGARVCARPLSLDGRPLVGRVPWIDGLWLVAGHGPWGISTGPGSAALLAGLVDGSVASPPRALDPGRFGAP